MGQEMGKGKKVFKVREKSGGKSQGK